MPDSEIDREADEQINACLRLSDLRSFFLFAGAGSGKTRSLVEALKEVRRVSGERLRLQGQRVAVITFTNAASDEVKRRTSFDPLVETSTIHSFVWSLIRELQTDIKSWVRANLTEEIAELEEAQRKGRAGTKAANDRAASIESKQRRLASLAGIKRFSYDPNGENRGRDSLNHSEVIKIGADFLTKKPLMQHILVSRFPILLIDESQDTNKSLMEAFLAVQTAQRDRFALGLIGDTMQRIYVDGKEDLGQNLPDDWAKPAKTMNHRCPLRVIRLINKVRAEVDGQEQQGRADKAQGFVRVFVLPNDISDKFSMESGIRAKMAEVTGDPLWSEGGAAVKTLILEHHMAARRMGFLDMFAPLYAEDSLRIGLLDGSLPGLRLFSQLVLPLVQANRSGDKFAVARIVRKSSPLLSKEALRAAGEEQKVQVDKAGTAVDQLMALWNNGNRPSFLDVLKSIKASGLFEIPEQLRVIASRDATDNSLEQAVSEALEGLDISDARIEAWDKFLATDFEQIETFSEYVEGRAPFDTHQGVKGLEFPRVMVVMDDEEARGFLFSYEKLFGAKDKTKADLENERDGKDTGIGRTRRLFYVTSSRAEESLALVAYSSQPAKVRDYLVATGWFDADEILLAPAT